MVTTVQTLLCNNNIHGLRISLFHCWSIWHKLHIYGRYIYTGLLFICRIWLVTEQDHYPTAQITLIHWPCTEIWKISRVFRFSSLRIYVVVQPVHTTCFMKLYLGVTIYLISRGLPQTESLFLPSRETAGPGPRLDIYIQLFIRHRWARAHHAFFMRPREEIYVD